MEFFWVLILFSDLESMLIVMLGKFGNLESKIYKNVNRLNLVFNF